MDNKILIVCVEFDGTTQVFTSETQTRNFLGGIATDSYFLDVDTWLHSLDRSKHDVHTVDDGNGRIDTWINLPQ